MKTATYLDSGFYIISDAAAGSLCRALGQKLPRWGYEKFVMLSTGEHRLNAWLQRTDMRACLRTNIDHSRGWRWALYALRPDGSRESVTLGSGFKFEAIANTQTTVAA